MHFLKSVKHDPRFVFERILDFEYSIFEFNFRDHIRYSSRTLFYLGYAFSRERLFDFEYSIFGRISNSSRTLFYLEYAFSRERLLDFEYLIFEFELFDYNRYSNIFYPNIWYLVRILHNEKILST